MTAKFNYLRIPYTQCTQRSDIFSIFNVVPFMAVPRYFSNCLCIDLVDGLSFLKLLAMSFILQVGRVYQKTTALFVLI